MLPELAGQRLCIDTQRYELSGPGGDAPEVRGSMVEGLRRRQSVEEERNFHMKPVGRCTAASTCSPRHSRR